MENSQFAHIKDQALIQALTSREWVKQETISKVLLEQNAGFQSATYELQGLFYELHLRERCLRVKESVSLTSLGEIELAPNEKTPFHAQDWKPWGEGVVLIDPAQPHIVDWLKESEWPSRGLVLSSKRSYIYSPELVHQPWLGLASYSLDPRSSVAEQQASTGPYDLYVSTGQDRVCLVDRAAGELSLISTQNHTLSEKYSLRDPGSRFSLNLVFDEKKHQIYFTDQEAPYLSVLDIQGGSLEQYTLDPEIPGNLWLDAKNERLYLLIKSPQILIRCLKLSTLETLYEAPLPGELWSRVSQAPTDLLLLTPQALVVMMRHAETGRPWLIFLNPNDLSQISEIQLESPLPPTLLALADQNPLRRQTRKLADLLVDGGYIEAEKILELFPSQLPQPVDSEETVLEIITPENRVVEVLDGEGELISRSVEDLPARVVATPSPVLAKIPRLPALLSLSPIESMARQAKPRKTDNLPLPEEVVGMILQILSASFFAQTGLDLSQDSEALEKLRDQAHYVRIRLQDYDAARVFLPDLYQGKSLQTVVLRDSVLTMQELVQHSLRKPFETPPTHCPACRTPLLGIWDCPSCGLELLSPERAMKRSMGSVLAQTWLPPGYFVIPDVNEGRLLLINTQRFNYVTWQMNFKVLPGTKQPWDMLWLENFHVLVTDRMSNRVFECDAGGREVWHLEIEKHPELRLLEPVKATRYQRDGGTHRTLIVDRGHHRILEVSPDQKITWEWGHRSRRGSSDVLLDLPSDVQYTHELSYLITDTGNDRVLEIREGRVFRRFGDYLELKRPVAAQRLLNGETLIADAGHYRLLIVGSDGLPEQEVVYYRPGLDERFRMDEPLHMVRRENQNVVLIDRNRVMEINVLEKKIVWFSFLHELHMEILPAELPEEFPHRMDTSKGFEQFKEPTPPSVITLQAMLKQIPLFAGAPWHFFEKLEKILHLHTYRKGERVLEKGKIGRSMFFLLSGSIEILNEGDGEAGMILHAGDSFGYMGIIFSEPRKSTLRVCENASIYELEKRELDRLLEHYPEIDQRRQGIAQERMVVSKLKQTPSSAGAALRLQSLIAQHKARAQQHLHSSTPARAVQVNSATKTLQPLQYNEIERRLLAQGASEGLNCLELHLCLSRSTRMKAARVSLIAHVLDKLGTLIKTYPSPEEILEEKLGTDVVFTLLTEHPPELVMEDLNAIVEVDGVTVLPIQTEN